MKKSKFAGISAIVFSAIFSYSTSFANNSLSNNATVYKCETNVSLFQDTTSKKVKPTKKAEIDRTKGEAGQGQGKGTDTIPRGTGAGKQGKNSEMNTGTDKAQRNSDNRGEGEGKNNRAGNSKKVIDTTKH